MEVFNAMVVEMVGQHVSGAVDEPHNNRLHDRLTVCDPSGMMQDGAPTTEFCTTVTNSVSTQGQ